MQSLKEVTQKMTKEENQQPQVSLETSSERDQSEESAATVEESSINVNSEALSQIIEKNGEDYLKALRRLMMARLALSLAGISKRK